MKYRINIIVLTFISAMILLLCVGCEQIVPNILPDPEPIFIPIPTPVGPSIGWIIIENDLEIVKDCTPALSIYSEGATYMSFSGDGENWSEWEEYSTYYEDFNIANGINGTEFSSGIKYVYVRFKDEEGNLSSSEEIAFDTAEFEFGELFSVKIVPDEVTVKVGESHLFTLHGYDIKSNEVPLNGSIVTWTKCCGVGNLSPATGLSTTYTAPSSSGPRNISGHYENLSTGAVVIVEK